MLFRKLIIAVLVLTGAQLSHAQSFTQRLSNVFGVNSASDEILDPDVAFLLDATVASAELIRLQWRIEDGYYLYRDKFKFALAAGPARIDQAKINLPKGKSKEDPAFGKVEINTGDVLIDLPLLRAGTDAAEVMLEVRYQGCKDESVCYPPITKNLPLLLPAFIPAANAETADAEGTPRLLSEQDSITNKLKDGSLLFNVLAFFGFGLLLSLTPCVFPMIPILSGIIVGQGDQITTGKAFTLSLFYVLAMALTYALLGVIAGSFYINLQATFQNPWIISLFSAVFVALAFSMFGFYELQLPAALQTRLNSMSNSQQGGTVHGAAIMGALSAIIVGPCVAPPLAGALLYISQTGDALLGGLALFAMGLGFGVPLVVIGSSAGSLLPKAGRWMEIIKQVFGVIMLAVAIWFMERILPAQISLFLWAALLIISSVFLGTLESVQGKSGWQRLWKGLGLLLLIYGVVLVIGAASGGRSIYRPLQGLGSGASTAQLQEHLPFTPIRNIDELDRALAAAADEGRHLMLDFYADWCVVCKEMEEYTFSDERVRTLLSDAVLVQADVTRNNEEDRALLKAFDIYGPPAILFFGKDGKEREAYRVVGFLDAEAFATHLSALGPVL